MSEPKRLGGEEVMRRMQAILEARGLDQIEPGPVDQTPSPDEPGHPEYHHRRRVDVALARWRTAAPFRYQEATVTHPDIAAWADRAAADLRAVGDLLLTGTFGTGKTHQAYGALRRIAEAGPDRFEMIAMTAPDMYGLLRPGGSDRGAEAELKRLCRIPLLLLDDLGTEKISEWTEEATYRLLNERYNECRPTIITSNLPTQSATGEDLQDKLGGRIVSRLSQMTTFVEMLGRDRRQGAA